MTIIGRVTKDAVVATLKDERKVVNFTVAVNDYYKQKGSDKRVTVTTFINCGYWISPAIAGRLTKGSLVEIAGRINVHAYTTMQGDAKASLNFHVNEIKVYQQVKADASKEGKVPKEPANDDLPF